MNIILSNVNCLTNKLLWAPKDAGSQKNPKDISEPYWYRQRHPHIYFYFYSLSLDIEDTYIDNSYIYGNNIDSIFTFLLKKFNVKFIYHTLSDFYINFNSLYNSILTKNYINESKILDNIDINKAFLYNVESGIYHEYNIGVNMKDINSIEEKDKISYLNLNYGGSSQNPQKWEIEQSNCIIKSNYVRPMKSLFLYNDYKLISLGGWCGPAVSLQELKTRQVAMPFDYMHASLKSINYIVKGYSQYFFDPKLTHFPHHDICKSEVKEDMYRRINRFKEALQKNDKPILFIRVVTTIDYQYEVEQVNEFLNLIKNKYSRDRDKVLMILHSQNIGTMKLKIINSKIMLTCAEGTVGWHVPNRSNIQRNYSKLIEYALDKNSWNQQILVKDHNIVQHTEKEWEKIKNM